MEMETHFLTNEDDTFNAGSADDWIIAEGGNDVISGNIGNDFIAGMRGNDTLNGGRDNDEIEGGEGDDEIKGGEGNDTLDGGSGNDTLNGGTGDDTLNGGAGEDTADYSSATQGINVTLGASGYATNDGFGYQDQLSGVDHIIGGSYSDTIVGDDNWNNKLEGGAGNDSLEGLGGHDTLDGGTGTNHLWGGEGKDIFVTKSGGLQIIKDFERGVDKIDMAGSNWNQISFDFDQTTNDTTIKVNNNNRAIVEGVMVDSTSLINTNQDITPKAINNINNIYTVLQGWAESYAESNGLDPTNVKLINNDTINLTPGTMEYVNLGELQASPDTIRSEMVFKSNKSTVDTVVFRYSSGTGYETSNQDTTSWSFDNTVGASVTFGASKTVGAEVGVPFAKVSGSTTLSLQVGANYSHTWSKGGSSTNIETSKVNEQTTTEFRFTSDPGAVTKVIADADIGKYSGAQYELPVDISGTVGIDLNGDGDTSATNEIQDLPVNAILQYYNPDTFVGQGLQRTYELPTGQVLLYNDTTEAKITGTLKGSFINSKIRTDAESAYDHNYSSPTIDLFANGIDDVHDSREDRYWLIRESQYNNVDNRGQGENVFRIDGFDVSQDFIGIDHSAINSRQDVLLDTEIPTGEDPRAKLILREGTFENLNTTQILMGGTGATNTIDDNDILAELTGITPDMLLGSQESLTRGNVDSNFMFGNEGTIWDNNLATGNGTNLLPLSETV